VLTTPLRNSMECDNCCLPHASLRQPLRSADPTHGSGAAQRGRPCTPAMAAGLTDHGWMRKEVLRYRVPPWPSPQALERTAQQDDGATERDRHGHKRQGGRHERLNI
jgi:hypothetical protein